MAINDICTIMEDPRYPNPIRPLANFVHYLYPRVECIEITYGALVQAYADPDWDSHAAISGGNKVF